MNLLELADKKQLPEFQYLDIETLNWIADHDPEYSLDKKLKTPANLQWFLNLRLDTLWFLEPKIVDSLHGERYALRCA